VAAGLAWLAAVLEGVGALGGRLLGADTGLGAGLTAVLGAGFTGWVYAVGLV